ncbi:MAG TPA: S8 family peptidase [Cryptosporangiaceae bacterium]|nr:S8 family peptidase [Cryptosporangiaceae bacterium]
MGQRRSPARRLLHASALVILTLSATFVASPAAAETARGTVLRATEGGISNSYIVVLKDTATVREQGVAATARSLLARHSGSLDRAYQKALLGFAATIDDAKAERLAADPRVAYVQQNRVHRASGTQTAPPSWGLDRIDQRTLPLNNSYTYPSTAGTVHAYIIDTGIRFSHQTFGGRAVSGRDTIDNDNNASDCNGHGTHVAGTVGGSQYGVAKAVRLVGVRVLNCSGSGTTAQVVAGIDWVTANAIKPAVANMSLGGGADTALDQAVKNSIASGISYGIAAGNGILGLLPQDACTQSPARVPEAITVSATQRDDRKPGWANTGTCVDIFAPGVDITSAWHTSDTATNTISGTSMATPHVVGAAAMYLESNPTATPQQVRDYLVNRATTGVVIGAGSGSPNKLLYVGP